MADQTRFYNITVSVMEGYTAVATDTLRAPLTMDLTLLQDIVCRKLGTIAQTVEEVYGSPYSTKVETIVTPTT